MTGDTEMVTQLLQRKLRRLSNDRGELCVTQIPSAKLRHGRAGPAGGPARKSKKQKNCLRVSTAQAPKFMRNAQQQRGVCVAETVLW